MYDPLMFPIADDEKVCEEATDIEREMYEEFLDLFDDHEDYYWKGGECDEDTAT